MIHCYPVGQTLCHTNLTLYKETKLERKKVQVQLFKYVSSVFIGRYRKTYSPLNKGKILFAILSCILGLAFFFFSMSNIFPSQKARHEFHRFSQQPLQG